MMTVKQLGFYSNTQMKYMPTMTFECLSDNSVYGQLLTYENDYNSGIEEAELLQKSCCFLEKDSLYYDSNIKLIA